MISISRFSHELINWYESKKRDLPWRKTRNPYLIWVSEIILQQTKVEQGLDYFLRFVETFPTVEKLAEANEEEVLNLWQGLGYYSRARNMKTAAETIMTEFNGKFPNTYEEIRSLKGIGDYTAAAISSFAYKQAYPVVDGNVMRVITRLFGIELPIYSSEGKKLIYEKAWLLLDKNQADIYNQAIMEFGALHCKPTNPNCHDCPFSADCVAYNSDKTKFIPLRKIASKKRNRYFNYAVITDGEKIVLKKREEKDIWKNLYDFPLIESEDAKNELSINQFYSEFSEEKGNYKRKKSDWFIHLLSHQKIHARFYEFNINLEKKNLPKDWKTVRLKEINKYPLPKLIESYINGL